MSHVVSQSIYYPLPANSEAVPESFKSSRAPRPINSQVSTVYVPAISGSQSEGGVSTIQLPLSSSAGYVVNPYLTWKMQIAGGTNTNRLGFSGPSGLCSALINSIQVSINGQQIDNLNNFDQLVDLLFTHASSADFVSHDATILMHAATQYAVGAAGTLSAGALNCICPLPGSLGSTGQAFPAALLQGSLQITINWNSIARALYMRNAADDGAGVAPTGFTISDVALVYDKVVPEQSFLEMVRAQLASGNKYIYSYTAYQTSTQQTNGASTATYSVALNRSSLRGVAMTQVATANLTDATSNKLSVNNSLSAFEVSLDGRRVNSVPLNTSAQPALCFAESQKVFSKLFDPSVSDVVSTDVIGSNASQGGSYLTAGFFVACGCLRTNEPLAFAGSPVSVLSAQYTIGATAATQFFHFISDEQMAISADGSVELLR